MNRRFVLKNKQGLYAAYEQKGDRKPDPTTTDLEKAARFTIDRAKRVAQYYNDDMQLVPYDTEVLQYYPHVAYHATDQIDAKRYVRKIHLGEADGQFSQAIAVCVEGLWFVHARREAVAA